MSSEFYVLMSTLGTGVIALIGLLLRYMYNSKCAKVECCWRCCAWERDVVLEVKQGQDTPSNNGAVQLSAV